MEQLTVALIAPAANPVAVTVSGPTRLAILQSLVGGDIERVILSEVAEDAGFDFYANEEGKLEGMPGNLNLGYDVVVGNVIVARNDAEGNTTSIEPGDLVKIESLIAGKNLQGRPIQRVRKDWGL